MQECVEWGQLHSSEFFLAVCLPYTFTFLTCILLFSCILLYIALLLKSKNPNFSVKVKMTQMKSLESKWIEKIKIVEILRIDISSEAVGTTLRLYFFKVIIFRYFFTPMLNFPIILYYVARIYKYLYRKFMIFCLFTPIFYGFVPLSPLSHTLSGSSNADPRNIFTALNEVLLLIVSAETLEMLVAISKVSTLHQFCFKLNSTEFLEWEKMGWGWGWGWQCLMERVTGPSF
jgi:hypothetical protein